MRPLSLLVTGFGPFPGVAQNASAWLVESLAASAVASRFGCAFRAEVLPARWDEASALGRALLEGLQPRLILHLGLSRRASGFRIERFARNEVAMKEDARGALPVSPTIVALGPDRLGTKLPAQSLTRHLNALGLPAIASRSAGTYLCNFLYYSSLAWAERQERPCDVAFVHVPLGPRQGGPLSEEDLLRGAEAILRYLLAVVAARDGARVRSTFARPETRL
jgi:pyroglutamyl-peptidase